MKQFQLGYSLANDYNVISNFSKEEFKYSFLHGIGYNIGVLKVKLFGYSFNPF